MDFEYLKHAMEGTVRATGQLRELAKERAKDQVSVPSQIELSKRIDKVEGAMYSNLAQMAKWNLRMIKEIESHDRMVGKELSTPSKVASV